MDASSSPCSVMVSPSRTPLFDLSRARHAKLATENAALRSALASAERREQRLQRLLDARPVVHHDRQDVLATVMGARRAAVTIQSAARNMRALQLRRRTPIAGVPAGRRAAPSRPTTVRERAAAAARRRQASQLRPAEQRERERIVAAQARARRAELVAAASMLQARARGMVTRAAVQHERDGLELAVKLQAIVRGNATRAIVERRRMLGPVTVW